MPAKSIHIEFDEPLKGDSFVYALIDPRDNQVRYIGLTTKGKNRFFVHMRKSDISNPHKLRWIEQLRKEGISFRVKILAYCEDFEKLKLLEIAYISVFKELGAKLTNITLGGEGTLGVKNKNGLALQDELGNTYLSSKDAEIATGIDYRTILDCAAGKVNTAKGKFFTYVDETRFLKAETFRAVRLSTPRANKGVKYSEEKRLKYANSPNLKKRKIIDNNGVVYNSVKEAVQKTGLGVATIHNSLSGRWRGRKLNFKYYEDKKCQ